MSKCRTGKRGWSRRKAMRMAESYRTKAVFQKRIRVYECSVCGRWHLTSAPPRPGQPGYNEGGIPA